MKRILCILLIMLLLCGCDVSGGAGQTASGKGAAHIVVTLPTIDGSDMTGLPEVQAAVNAITIPYLLQASILSWSRMEPPGSAT